MSEYQHLGDADKARRDRKRQSHQPTAQKEEVYRVLADGMLLLETLNRGDAFRKAKAKGGHVFVDNKIIGPFV